MKIEAVIKYFILCIFSAFIIPLTGCTNQEPKQTTGTVSDIDGNKYTTVRIGDQWWMAENLRVTRYRTGEEIPNITDGEEWCKLTSGAYSAYDNDSSNIPTYGLLYNWYAAADSQGICPEGWHVPTDGEWMELEKYLGVSQKDLDIFDWRGKDQGEKLKETGSNLWESTISNETNESGFSALPGGGRASDRVYKCGFFKKGIHIAIWSSSEESSKHGIFRVIEHDQPGIKRNHYNKGNGFAIRCVMD